MRKKFKRRFLIVGVVFLALIIIAAVMLLNVDVKALGDLSNESYVTFVP